jgi:CheY-like chemotaxis protein
MKQPLKCILVIDDDEPTIFFARTVLEQAGCAQYVRTVQSGREALEYLAKSQSSSQGEDLYPRPDLVLLDINMPAMNGWEFLDEYRKMDVKQRSIMVMWTTSLFPGDKAKAEAMPEISGFENKPGTAENVVAVVEKYFPGVAPK